MIAQNLTAKHETDVELKLSLLRICPRYSELWKFLQDLAICRHQLKAFRVCKSDELAVVGCAIKPCHQSQDASDETATRGVRNLPPAFRMISCAAWIVIAFFLIAGATILRNSEHHKRVLGQSCSETTSSDNRLNLCRQQLRPPGAFPSIDLRVADLARKFRASGTRVTGQRLRIAAERCASRAS